jgi:hypothetical protein
MTRVIAPRHHLFMRLTHAAHHMTDHLDHLAGAPGPAHLMFAVATTFVALTHRTH